jgi:hypothetical protein
MGAGNHSWTLSIYWLQSTHTFKISYMHNHQKRNSKSKRTTHSVKVCNTYFMLDVVPLSLCSAMQVHIVPPVLHYEPLKFPDTLKLQFNTTHHQSL